MNSKVKRPFITGITGGSASGKTLFLEKMLAKLPKDKVCLISQDNYYKPRDQQPKDGRGIHNFDRPDSIDFQAFANDLQLLSEGKTITRQEYTFNNPNKNPKMLTFTPTAVIVVEGIFVFYHPDLMKHFDLKVFIEAKEHVMLKRRILRDKMERGYDLDDVLYRFEHHVMPAYDQHIMPLKAKADIIIPNNYSFDRALDVLLTYLKEKV